jgi:phosphoglycolate phosphatase-like HAD superfamily hydrolase
MRLVLFDVDGTLLLARGAGRRALGRALVEVFGTAGALDRYDLRGTTDVKLVHDVLAGTDLAPARIEAGLERCFECYARHLTLEIGDGAGVQVLPGIAALVPRLEHAGALLGLLTGNTEAGARIKLGPTGLWPYFRTGAYGSEHRDRRCLGPLAVGRAAALAGREFPPDRMVVVGDTTHDVDCARALGAMAVAVATGQVSREELARAEPDLLFDDFADVERAAALLLGTA